MSLLKHIKAILILPFSVLAIVPSIIVLTTGIDTFGILATSFKYILVSIGILFIFLGLSLMAFTIKDMHQIGKATLAPWDKKEKLVIAGLYRHVRNPMLTGVLTILLGESLALASLPILFWFLTFATINAIYIAKVEEKELLKQFGSEYEEYRQNVPAWIPRLKAYKKEASPREQ